MQYTIENTEIKCVINSKGAELASFYNKTTQLEYMWQADPAVWGRHAPVLFPIVGQVLDNKYEVEGQVYELSQHGFARDREMELLEENENEMVFGLEYDDESLKKYPYKFELKIAYTLEGKSLKVKYEVTNLDDKSIYFSIGAHPGFACPLQENETFSDYEIKFNKKITTDRLLFADGLLTGEKSAFMKDEDTIPLSHSLFDNDAIIFEELEATSCKLQSTKSSHGLKFDFEGFPFLAFWTKPGASAPYICIEPWYGIADTRGGEVAYTEKKGIQQLAIGEKFTALYVLTSF